MYERSLRFIVRSQTDDTRSSNRRAEFFLIFHTPTLVHGTPFDVVLRRNFYFLRCVNERRMLSRSHWISNTWAESRGSSAVRANILNGRTVVLCERYVVHEESRCEQSEGESFHCFWENWTKRNALSAHCTQCLRISWSVSMIAVCEIVKKKSTKAGESCVSNDERISPISAPHFRSSPYTLSADTGKTRH